MPRDQETSSALYEIYTDGTDVAIRTADIVAIRQVGYDPKVDHTHLIYLRGGHVIKVDDRCSESWAPILEHWGFV